MIRVLAHRGVRWRVTVAVSLLFTVALVGGAALFLNRIETALVSDVHAAASLQLEHVRDVVATRPPPDGSAFEVFQPEVGSGPLVVVVDDRRTEDGSLPGALDGHVTDHGEGVVEPVQDVEVGRASAIELREQIAAGGEDVPDWLAVAEGEVAVTSLPARTPDGPVRLLSASPLDAVRQTVDTARRVMVGAVPLLIGLIGLSAWGVAGRALRPVEAITRRADEITATTLDARVPEPATGDEVAHLARTVNGMLERLEAAATTQRRFTADAAHELRTPVATIRTELEVALRDSSPDWEGVARRVLVEDLRLGALVDDLLLLARGDEVTSGPARDDDVDLAAVVDDSVVRRRDLPVDLDVPGLARVRGDAVALGRALDHLVDNAVRHASSTVRVTLHVENGTAIVHVDDDGSGIPVADRDRVLERFARLDEARSRDRGGAGLGLAVVDHIVTRHGGSVTIDDAPLGGARVTLRIPTDGHAVS